MACGAGNRPGILTTMNDGPLHEVPAGSFPGVVPVLTDGRVRLRPMTEGDLPAVVQQSNDPETVRWTTVPQPYDLVSAREFLALHASGWAEVHGTMHWAIELLDHDGEPGTPFAGIIDLRPSAKGDAWETGFVLHPAARGRGVMSGALRLAAGWAFAHGAPSLYWFAARGNFASWRVAHACGFTHLGTLPRRIADRTDTVADAWVAALRPGEAMVPVHPWLTPRVLEAEGLRLRELRETDRALAEPHDHPTHHVPTHAVPTPQTFDEWVLRRLESSALGTGYVWCITEPASDEAIGEVLIFVRSGHLAEGGTAEVGYTVRPSARGHGVARRAAGVVVEHALTPVVEGGLGLRRLVAETAADHEASNRVLTGAGFTVWGRESAADAPDGSVGPALHWERLAEG